ncbi:MAG TPA: BTAD domain-containing putative transcriptional regulator [Nitriliruptoraceae bacterium]|nr:BTAD domain-containing putative transcriptional regulator [Nitriliruptoraceae bacterium]
MTVDRNSGAMIRVFGGASVDSAGEPVNIGGPRQRRLLALLALRAGAVVSVDWLAQHLWDDHNRPVETTPALRVYVSRLRAAMPGDAAEWIATAPSGYRLAAPSDVVEHLHFRNLRTMAARASRAGDPQTAHDVLAEALTLWRGDPFRELDDVAVARAEIEQLHVDRLEMLEERWEAALALGRHTQITGELAAFTLEHGLRDRAVRQRALALHRSGRTADGVAVVAEHRRLLADKTGLDPSPAMVALEEALLTGDPTLDVGRPLRGYTMLEQTARGTFSVVWKGLQPSVDRPVAIKQIRAELASRPGFIRRFESEARLVARLEHPHVVPLIDYWRDPGSAYLVMQWMAGGTLEDKLRAGPLELEETLALASQVGAALSAAHARGVVHRDVKPANILFDEFGNAFLGDFGIAATPTTGGHDDVSRADPQGLAVGTPAYASPEQARGDRPGPPADLFSLGVVLVECLTGAVPERRASTDDADSSSQQLLTGRPAVPENLGVALQRATIDDPQRRFSTADELLAALGVAPRPVLGSAGDVGFARSIDLPDPYVGLRAFDDGDAERFFGRDALVAEVTARLRNVGPESRCVAVVGPSGSGKSSVVRAGVVPALRAGAVPGSEDWFVTTMVPGNDPYASLEAALLRVAIDPPASLPDRLRSGPTGIVEGARLCMPDTDAVVVVVVDQFEEVFTNSPGSVVNSFLAAMATAVNDDKSPLRLVLTVRADHYHRPLGHPSFAGVLKRAAIDVTPMTAVELEQAITRPARPLGIRFEQGLVARIAADAVGRIGSLPLLQYALGEVFDRREGALITSVAYDRIGGLTGALTSRAEQLHLEGDDDERAATRRLFGRLTNPLEQGPDIRRRVPLADLEHDAPTRVVVARFGEARLLTFDRDEWTRAPTVEVSHEALLREWPRLADWLTTDRDLLRTSEQVAAAASAWDEGGRVPADLYRGGRLEAAATLAANSPEHLRPLDLAFIEESTRFAEQARLQDAARLTRLRRLVVGTAMALVVAVLAAGVAIGQRQRAVAAAREAELQSLVALSGSQIDQDPDLAILLALEAHRRAPGSATEGAVLAALAGGTAVSRIASVPIVGDLDECPWVGTDATNVPQFGVVDGLLAVGGPGDDTVSFLGPAPADCVYWLMNPERSRMVVIGPEEPGQPLAIDAPRQLYHGEGVDLGPGLPLTRDQWVLATGFLAQDRLALVDWAEARAFVVDAMTGVGIGTGVTGEFVSGSAITEDGMRFVVGFANPSDPDRTGELFVVDAATGESSFSIVTSAPPSAIDIDERTGDIVAALEGGRVVRIDPAVGEIHDVSRVTTTSPMQQLRVLDDGRIIVVSASQIEVIESSGEVGRIVPVRDIEEIGVTVDGRVRATTSDDRWETYDVDGNALTEATIPFGERGTVVIAQGRAVVTYPPDGRQEVIELSTGAREPLEVGPADGVLIGAEPYQGGFWALTVAPFTMTHWRDGDLVAEVELPGSVPESTGGFIVASSRPDDPWLLWIEERGWRISLDPGDARVLQEFGPAEAAAAVPSLDGGAHTISPLGVVTTHGPGGDVVGTFDTDLVAVRGAVPDPASDRFFVFSGMRSGVVVVDPVAQTTRQLSIGQVVSSLTVFGDAAHRIVVATEDGAVRLWDVADDRLLGVAYQGTGATSASSWYDRATDTVWVVTGERLVQIPVEPERWIAKACAAVGRDLTPDEWDQYVPGGGDPVPVCTL